MLEYLSMLAHNTLTHDYMHSHNTLVNLYNYIKSLKHIANSKIVGNTRKNF